MSEIKANLKTLYASGGGDGPEAVTAAMYALTEMEWRQRATRMAVLIADAPPHGIGEVSGEIVWKQLANGVEPTLTSRNPEVRRWLPGWFS